MISLEHDSKFRSSEISAYSLLGWVTGALSMLGLLDDLKWVKIHKHLQQWLDIYTQAIKKVTHVLFGWINFYWLSISTNEGHVLVLMALVAVAVYRASQRRTKRYTGKADWTLALGIGLLTVFPVFLAELLLPGELGLLGGFSIFFMLSAFLLTRETTEADEKAPFVAT